MAWLSHTRHTQIEADTHADSRPIWRCADAAGQYWVELLASPCQSHFDLGWQAEGVWPWLLSKEDNRMFHAVMGVLEWDVGRCPVYCVLICMRLHNRDQHTKTLQLLVKPAGTPRQWHTFTIHKLQKCVYMPCYKMNMIHANCDDFQDTLRLRRTVLGVLRLMPLRHGRLQDTCHGRLQDL